MVVVDKWCERLTVAGELKGGSWKDAGEVTGR